MTAYRDRLEAGEYAPPSEPGEAPGYESLTKPELVELARSRGISPASHDQTKAELVAALEAAD